MGKGGLATDICYWIFVPTFPRYLRIRVTVAGTVLLFHFSDGQTIAEFYAHGHGPLSRLSPWLQAGLYLVATRRHRAGAVCDKNFAGTFAL